MALNFRCFYFKAGKKEVTFLTKHCPPLEVCAKNAIRQKMEKIGQNYLEFSYLAPIFAIPVAIYRSAFRARAGKCPTDCFLSAPKSFFECFWDSFGAKKTPKSTQKALFGALRARCPKTLKKQSVGHFPAQALKALL